MYVIFEGVDTSGKSTQLDLFQKRHNDVIATKEPGGTALGVKLRSLLLESDSPLSTRAEMLLFLADRAEHYENIVKTNRNQKNVLSDRGFISGLAYAMANNSDIDMELLIEFNRFSLQDTFPEKVVLFLTNKELITHRLGSKDHDSIEQRGIEYLLEVQKYMLQICKDLQIKTLHVDATESIENIYKNIEEFLYD